MASVSMITTTAGKAAIVNALSESDSIEVVDALLSGVNQSVTAGTSSLSSVVATLPVVGSVREAGGGFALHMVLTDDSAAAYDVRAIAVRMAGGAFLLVASQAALIATKSAGSTLHLAFDLTIDAATAATITFGATDYALPMASEIAPGMIELATLGEAIAGTDTVRVITPKGLNDRIRASVTTNILVLATEAQATFLNPPDRSVMLPMSRFRVMRDVNDIVGNVALDWIASGQEANLVLHNRGSSDVGYAQADFQFPSNAKVLGLQVMITNPGSAVYVSLGYRTTNWPNAPFTSVYVSQNIVQASGRRTINITRDPSAAAFAQNDYQDWYVFVRFPFGGSVDVVHAIRMLYQDPGPRNH